MPESLAVRYSNRSGNTTVQVFRQNNGTFTAIGAAYTPTALVADAVGQGLQNLAVQFGDRFYCCAGSDVRLYDPASGTWTTTGGIANYAPYANRPGSLHVGKGPTGAPRLMLLFRLSTQRAGCRYLDSPGGTWSAAIGSGLSIGTGFGDQQGATVINNTVYAKFAQYVVTVNISTLTFTTQVVGAAIRAGGYFTRVGSRVFMGAFLSTSATLWLQIYEQTGGTFVNVLDGSTQQTLPRVGSNGNANRPAMFYDEAAHSLILVDWADDNSAGTVHPGGDGLYVTQVPVASIGTGTETNITSTVDPGGSFIVPTGPDPTADVQIVVELDTDTDPAAPVRYIWMCGNAGNWTRYQWRGVGNTMVPGGSGGDRGIALTHNPSGGGEYYYAGSTTASPAIHVEESAARVAVLGGTRVTLRGYVIDETGGSPTAPDKTVALYYGTGDEPEAANLATITNATKVSGPGSAPVIVGNKITNFSCDSSTVYSVEWQAVSDGLSQGDRHLLMPRAE